MEVQSMGSGVTVEMVFHRVYRILQDNNGSTPPENFAGNSVSKFNPSMAIIIIVLISAFLFMGFFSIYVRRCTQRSDDGANTNVANQQRTSPSGGRPSQQGLDKSVVENLPLVGYPLVKGLEGGKDLHECAVCLSDFEDEDNVRLLPKCGHIFHPDCIDMWFDSHSTCPLCRASLVPIEGKEVEEGESAVSEEYRNWVRSRGTAPDGETFTIHDGPPVPPNGSILELLSQDGAERILADSVRLTERLDAGLARREGEDENAERAAGIRALNRALSKNSASFRKASRGFDATDRIDAMNSGSARFNSSSVAIDIDGIDAAGGRDKKGSRSIGPSQSFNMVLRRSSSVGSSGRYLRQLLGITYETFSPGSGQDGSRLLDSEQELPKPVVRRDRSARELRNIEIPVWENIDLNGENGGLNGTSSDRPGVLPPERWASRRRKLYTQDFPVSPGPKRVVPSEEACGPLYTPRKEKEGSQVGRTKSDRWNFGQSLRRTFSFKKTTASTSSDVESLSQHSSNLPGPSASKNKKYSSWAGAMKIRRASSADSVSSPYSPSSMGYPESFPLESVPQSPPLDSAPQSRTVPTEQQNQSQQHQQRRQQSPAEDPVHIITRP
jgi:hypothetical protein